MTSDAYGSDVSPRIAALDWTSISAALDDRGYATTDAVLSSKECQSLIDLYEQEPAFRKRVVMQQHGYGQGEYRYFAYPLPPLIAGLREGFYAPLARIANRWAERLHESVHFPVSHAEFLSRCHAAGQLRPTPLLLRYRAGDFNCLHQDVYGEQVFPLQAVFLLSEPKRDFDGGEFVLVEQRARMQSRAHVVPLTRGEAVIFATRERPVEGIRGSYRMQMRHGVSSIRRGERLTAGLIFHDAQ